KIPRSGGRAFFAAGFRVEAEVPGFFRGREDALFLCRYLDARRARERRRRRHEAVLSLARGKRASAVGKKHETAAVRRCGEADVARMAELYADGFRSYPFPIHDPDYLLETMRSHVVYFGAEVGGKLVALASAEQSPRDRNAEMTDFITLPQWRGRGLAGRLLERMESHARAGGVAVAYTIARALSPGMNSVFARSGYRYGGRLINNTNIAGSLESMNVWYKPLAKRPGRKREFL
ncbi:MAG TPA: putative beta-lysine N-acetyltransferase, partial [bacterium]|nr:putative beta-lysine N-acetyltransferase [bacterium]